MKFFPMPRMNAASAIRTSLLLALSCGLATAQTGQQTINLVDGWNALWLEVQPTYDDQHANAGLPMSPEDAFDTATNTSISVIASPKPLAGLAEFFGDDPTSTGTFNQAGWQQWQRNDPAGTNDLALTLGNRPYLIQVVGTPVTINLQGKVRFFKPTWTPDRYNLVGFGIAGTTSFDDFFGPSGGRHPVSRIYTLDAASGNWSTVNPSAAVESGKAYWVFSAGPSDYTGPVSVSFDTMAIGTFDFGGPSDAVDTKDTGGAATGAYDLEEIVFTNLGNADTTPTLTRDRNFEFTVSEEDELDLAEFHPDPTSLDYVIGNGIGANFTFGDGEVIASGSTAVLTMGANAARDWNVGRVDRVRLHRLRTGTNGAEFWLPIRAQKTDLQSSGELELEPDLDNPTSILAGLWVGEAVLDSATSIVEDGAPVRPAAAKAPIRVLLHADSSGAVQLLSQVTVMQTKSADPSIAPIPVLVIDPDKIPFYEGIKERNGKRVGIRLDAMAFDMPRRLDATSQAALLSDPAYPDLTEEGITDFLLARSLRPPSLAEAYHLSWPLEGAIGAGKTVQTGASDLVLDPFHRSNPLRHAFHQKHARGVNISRSVEIRFDDEQAVSGRLTGTYRETLRGLTKSDLELTGRVEFHHASTVDTLD